MRQSPFTFPVRIAWFLLVITPALLQAQQVYWEPDRASIGVGKAFELTLVFENCTPDGTVEPPEVDGLDFGNPSTVTETNMMNFQVRRRYLLRYPAAATREGEIRIPPFSVATSEGSYTVPEARFEAGAAAVGQSGVEITDLIKTELRLSRSTVWVGEVVDAEYVIASSPRHQASLAGEPQWSPQQLVREPFGEPERVSVTIGNEQWQGLRFRTRFIATEAGTFPLDPVVLRVNVQTGQRTGFFGFSQPQVERFTVSSDPRELIVRPLPEPAPPEFNGAIGLFEFESKVVPDAAAVGDPITWTLTLQGAGNWPANLALPEREVSADFEVVQPEVEQTMDDGRLFNGSLTEDAVLIPTKAGEYELGPVDFTFFNTTTGKYETTVVPPVTVVVEPPAGTSPRNALPQPSPAPENVAPPTDADTTPNRAPDQQTLPRTLPAPSPLPRDPLPTGETGTVPLGLAPAWWLLVALAPPLLGWLALAWRQLRRTDKARERRMARRSALALLQQWERSGKRPVAGDLILWRETVARLWRISRATPTREDLARAISVLGKDGDAARWLDLWQQTDDALFGSERPLPDNWINEARSALDQVQIERLAPRVPLRRRYWLPRLTLLLLFLSAVVANIEVKAAAATALDAYRAGQHPEAREHWMRALAQRSDDWTVHHNLGLAWAQEEKWAEASAHWTAAFLLCPRNESVRANLTLALNRLGGLDPAIRRILAGSAVDRTATILSPGEWGYLYLIGAVMFASGLLAAIVGLYRRERVRRWRRFGYILALLGLLCSVAALAGQSRYGALAQPTAGLVIRPTELRSIPTELAERQQTAPVAPGTVVVTTRTFLGWHRVTIGESVTGWLRRDAFIPFFESRVEPKAHAPAQDEVIETVRMPTPKPNCGAFGPA